MKRHTALITGFEPFANGSSNPSWLAVNAMADEIGPCKLVKVQLPVSFKHAYSELENAISTYQPELVICTGLASKRNCLSVERVAINIDDARIPDNNGDQPSDRIIDYSAPNAYFSCLPNREIITRITQAGLPAAISDSAGTYVCNHVMFRLLHLIASQKPHMMGGFIHVPALPEMLPIETTAGGMPLADITRALTIAVQTCAEHIASGSWKGSKIAIQPYNPSWPQAFAEISDKLHEQLGNLALRIDHIGSTAVPGLAAKDIIDIQITVNALDDRLLNSMTAMGYSRSDRSVCDHMPPGMSSDPRDWQKWFFRAPPEQRRTNTHVRIAGRANQRYPLLFRDFLRAHPSTAQAYGELKKRLAANIANSSMYPDVKDPAVDLIYFAAEKWAQTTGW